MKNALEDDYIALYPSIRDKGQAKPFCTSHTRDTTPVLEIINSPY
jgi:hypothetical protein